MGSLSRTAGLGCVSLLLAQQGFRAGSRVSAMISEPLAVGWMPSCWMVPGTWIRSL